MRRIGGDCHPQTTISPVMCRAPVFFCGLLSWGPGSGFSMIFQSSTTAISQPWHPTVAVTDWQDTTFDCHVLYSTEPFSSWGCHQGSTSTGIAVHLVWVYLCVFVCESLCLCVWSTQAFIMFVVVFFYTCRRYKQHEFIPYSSAGKYATL